MEYSTLFLISFAAATILPVSSEATLYYYLREGLDPLLLLLFAGTGNTMGSVLNYLLGRKGTDYLIRRGKISPASLHRSEKFFGRWGGYSLLLSWLPIVGDPLTLVAGALHYRLSSFILIVSIAKFGRYALIVLFS